MKAITLSLLLIVVHSKTCQGVPTKNPDGSIIWEPLPSLGEFIVDPDTYKTDGNRPATLADMSRGMVNFLQPNGFPIDYAVHLIEMVKEDKDPDVLYEVLLGMENFLGITICYLLGILFFVLLPWIAIFFFCCRCCGNCGGKREQELSNLCLKQIGLSLCLAASLGVLCGGAVCIDFSNTFMTQAKDTSFQTSFDALDDLQTFTTGSSQQLSHILEDEYKFAASLALDDLNNVGKLVAAPFETYLLNEVHVRTLFNEFDNLITDLNDTNDTLVHMDISRTFLIQSEEEFRTQLNDVSVRLDDINATCLGCVPPNQGLTLNVNFTHLPHLDDQISGATAAISDVGSLYNQGLQAVDQIEADIDKVAEEPATEIEVVINSTSDEIAEKYREANEQLTMVLESLGDYEELLEERLSFTDEYIVFRDYAMLGLSLTCFLIFGIFVIGLIMGSIFSKDVDPRYRSRGSNCCGNFLMLGVVLTFLLTPLLMLLTSGLFLPLSPATLTCKPLKNLKLINETIDQPDLISEGYFLGDLILGNSSIPLTFTSILEDCEQNATIYNTLQLEYVININELKKLITEVRNQTDKLLDEIDIGDLDLSDLVPDDLGAILRYAVDQIKLELIDYDTIETLLQEELLSDDLQEYSLDLETAADENPDVATELRQAASDLNQIHQMIVIPIEDSRISMLSDTHHIQALITQLDRNVNETTRAGLVVEIGLYDTQALEAELDQAVEGYIDVIIGYLDQFVDVAIEQFSEDFGRCYPIRAIYDAVINVLCHYDFESLNTVWFSLGWCTIWMIISLIFAVKLAKYLRIMDTIPEPQARTETLGREGTYRSRPHTDTIRSFQQLDNYDNQAYHDYYGYQHDDQELVHLPTSSQTDGPNVSHQQQANPTAPPPSYEEGHGQRQNSAFVLPDLRMKPYTVSLLHHQKKMAIYEQSREYAVTSPSNGDNFSYTGLDDGSSGNSAASSNVTRESTDTEKIIVGIVCAIMIIVVLFGNTLVVVAVCSFRHLRTPTNFLLLNLAVADIFVASLVMTFSLGRLLNDGYWFAGEVICKLWMSLDVLCCTASIMNLCMISLDKYWAITRPLSYKSIMSKRRTLVMICTVWILSSVISFVPILSNLHADKSAKTEAQSCSVNFVVNHYYAAVSAATSFYLPLTIMLFTYCRIYTIAHSQIQRIMLETPRDPQGSAKKRVRTLAKEFKAVRTLGVIMGCFILCWLPFFLMYVIVNFCATCLIASRIEDAIVWLGYANSMINPFIYNRRHVEFKKAFRAIMTCKSIRSINREATIAANSQSDLWATNSRRNSLRKLSTGSSSSLRILGVVNGSGGYLNGVSAIKTSPSAISMNSRCMSIIKEISTPSQSQEQINDQLLGEYIQIPHLKADEEVADEEDV